MNNGGPKATSGSGPKYCHLAGRNLLLDQEGFLVDPQEWSEEVALEMAREEGLPGLEEVHWRVIRFLRNYYFTYGKAPLSHEIKKGIGISLLEIEALFPGGLKAGARRLGGLPNPRGCL